MIVAGYLMLPAEGEAVRLVPGHLRIEDGVVTQLVEGELPRAELCDAGGPNCVVLPGLVDAHVHLPQFDIIGAHGLPLLEWLEKNVWPTEARWADTAFAQAMTNRVLDQLFAAGTTAIAAYATVHGESVEAALRIANQRGMNGVIGQTLMDRAAPDELCRPAEQLLNETGSLLETFSDLRCKAAVTPRFALSCSEALLNGAGKLAQEHQAIVQTHLAETIAECDAVADVFDGKRYVEVYRDAGLVRQGAIFGHGIHLNNEDRGMLAESESIVAHCPTANAFLASGRMDWAAHRAANLAVALGSDIGAGYERSMVRVAREMVLNAGALGHTIPASQAWWQITAGNASALRLEDTGKLTVGTTADLLLVEPDDQSFILPHSNETSDGTLGKLMFNWNDRWLKSVWVRGKRFAM